MLIASVISLIFLWLLQAESAPWWNKPGLEVWKFVNLAIFVLALIYILTRKVRLGEALRARREQIRRELMRAQEERKAALEKLQEVEGRLARLDQEVAAIREQSRREADEERERIRRSTEED